MPPRSEQPSAVRQHAGDGGYAAVYVLAIENDFWRFYRLSP